MRSQGSRRALTCVLAICASLGLAGQARAADLSEGFDDIATLPGSGWQLVNNSEPIGTQPNWFQGAGFAAHTDTGFIAANFNNASGAGTISNWLITPVLPNLTTGDEWSFWTRKATIDTFPDRLEVRLSTNGSCTPGPGAMGVGDFQTLLLSINPNLVTGVYPTTWTEFTGTLSGLAGPQSGCLAFRYFVTNAGPAGTNSDYIGVDTFSYADSPDTTPPTVSILDGPAGTTRSSTPTFAFGANETVTFTCRIHPQGGPVPEFGTCSGPGNTHTPASPLASGAHTFEVRGVDAAGNAGTATRSFTVDTSRPPRPSACDRVQDRVAAAQAALEAAKAKLKKAKKKLAKAKKSGKAGKVKKAKRKVKKAKKAVKAAEADLEAEQQNVADACAPVEEE